MGLGANYGLDKGCLVEGTTAIVAYTIASRGVGSQTCKNATTAGDANIMGVFQESIDATRLANVGKVVANVRIFGISRVKTGGVFAKGDPITNDATGRAVKQTTAGARSLGLAEEASTAANQYVNVSLTTGPTI